MQNSRIVRWTQSGGSESWMPTTLDQLGKDEKFFEDVLAETPELLGLESRRTGIRGPYCLFQQRDMETPSGRSIRPDIVVFAASGHVIVVEVKRSTNPELRDRKVIAQIIDYASSFASLSDQQCIDLFGEVHHTTWSDCVVAMFPHEPSQAELAEVLLERMQSGDLNLVIACDQVPPGLPEIVSGIASQSTLGFDLDLVEVVPHVREVSKDAEILFVPATRLATEIVARTAVTVTYRQGDSKPSTTVQTTSIEEVEENARKAKRNGKIGPRPERFEYWQAFCKYLHEYAPDIKTPRPTDGASMKLPLGSTSSEVAVGVYGGPDRMWVWFEGIQSLLDHRPEIEDKLGGEVFGQGKLGRPVIVSQRPVDISDKPNWPQQHKWFLDTIRQFDQALSPYIPTERV